MVFYFSTLLLLRVLPGSAVIGFWTVTLSVLYLLRKEGVKKEREVFNPLVGILDWTEFFAKPLDKPALNFDVQKLT
jgi:hypothetical protein